MSQGQIDLLLINPATRKRVYQSLGDEFAAIEPPVWAGMIATYMRVKGASVAVLDAEAENLDAEEAAQRVQDLGPALVAVVVYGHQPSASTQIMPASGDVCRAIKRLVPEQKIVLVGGHVAALPERTLREEAADFVAGGEGLVTLYELLSAVKANDTDYAKVSDLYWRDGDAIVPPRRCAPLLNDLDSEMPGIAWDLLPMNRYRAHNWHCMGHTDEKNQLSRSPYAAIYTTLGCPFKCTFCCIHAPFKSGEAEMGMRTATNSYRFWSPKRIVNDLELLVTHYGVRHVKFADEMFVMNKRHVESICDLIIERGLDLNIWAYSRVDTIKDGMLPKLKKAGFNWLALGIEAANPRVRTDVQKGFGQESIRSCLENIWSEGIYIIGNFIFGLPEDDMQTMQETLDMAMDLNCEFGNFYSTMAYPGSALYDLALANGWQLPDTWSGYSQHSIDTLPLRTRHVTAPQVLRFRDEAFMKYYTAPRYLESIERKFGMATVDHIRHMTSHRLERKNA